MHTDRGQPGFAAWTLGLIAALGLGGSAAPAEGQQVSGDEVRFAVKAAVDWLERVQQPNGGWEEYRHLGGTTALATLALINAGVSPREEWMQRAIAFVRAIPLQSTYAVSLKIQALAAADPIAYRREIQLAADWLVAAQQRNGMWGYGFDGGHTDFSNSQFALLGLHEASKAGARVRRSAWRAAEKSWTLSQLKNGGWGYQPHANQATGSMTTAGLASLYITGHSLHEQKGHDYTDRGTPCCGNYTEFRPISRGLHWLAANFRSDRNPGTGSWYYYYLYGVERVGILSGLRFLGPHDWYRAGAANLVRLQKQDGYWREQHAVADTAFALLFLAKGHRPVLIQKLKWSNDSRWNRARNDLAHLVGFLGDKLGEPVSWEVVPLEADLEEWLRAPLLFFNGRQFPAFKEQHLEEFREYVRRGGTILAEASCGHKVFREGFTQFVERTFADYEMRRLPPDHPVFSVLFALDGANVNLHGVDVGCRTSVFYSPDDLSCLWEYGNVPRKSKAAFELGCNIAAYATGLEPLSDKLDVVRIERRSTREAERDTPPRGALYVAQLMHNGDWRPNPRAIPSLADELHDRFGVDVVRQYAPLRATDPELARHPIVYMAGHFTFALEAEEIAALRQHIERGGFLFATACCGRQPFDTAFRELAAKLFPEHPLKPLPADHPIITGLPGLPLPEVTYKSALAAEQPRLKRVSLERIDLDGRTGVVYSRFSLDCGLDGHACFGCRGPIPEDARRIAANVILYALTY